MATDESTAPASGRPGRPRDASADRSILDATVRLLALEGDAGVTTDRIAAEAGVSKATIYRRWRTKDDIVVAAVEAMADQVPTPDTGTLRGDLTALAHALVDVFAAPLARGLIAALVGRIAHDPALASALRDGFLAARRTVALRVLERARDRGELRAGVDLGVAVDLLAAPFYYRILVTGGAIDRAWADHVVDAVVAWVHADRVN